MQEKRQTQIEEQKTETHTSQTFHARAGWVGEIKYGLIAAARETMNLSVICAVYKQNTYIQIQAVTGRLTDRQTKTQRYRQTNQF